MSICLKHMQFYFTVLIIALLYGNVVAADPEQKAPPEIKKGTVTGKVMVNDRVPLSWGQIMFYDYSTGPPPIPDKYERTPDISKSLDYEGNYKVEVPEGRYYIGAIKRISGDRLGPPQNGDYVYRSLNEKGLPKIYTVQAGQVLDVGMFTGAFQIADEDLAEQHVTTALKGVIYNMDWQPVAGAVVLAFTERYLGKKPLFVSNKSGVDGKYILPLTEGTYYLRVRNSFAAGPPEPGQIVGYYGEGTPSTVPVKEREIIEGIDFQVIVFQGRGPGPNSSPNRAPNND